ncbi:hypothetical protein GJ496_003072 [Pomphorhynchus laevis]|nr:hypothetical protein GJ496_003072 [Pomphorhynchus laevis]
MLAWRILEMSKVTRFIQESYKFKGTSPGGVFWDEYKGPFYIRSSMMSRYNPKHLNFLVSHNVRLISDLNVYRLVIQLTDYITLHLLEEAAITHALTSGVTDTKKVENALAFKLQVSSELADRLFGLLLSGNNVYDNTGIIR